MLKCSASSALLLCMEFLRTPLSTVSLLYLVVLVWFFIHTLVGMGSMR